MKKYDISDIKELMDNSFEIGSYLFEYYLKRIYGTGNFYTLKKSKNLIKASKLSDKDKTLMLELIQHASLKRSLHTAVYELQDTYGKKSIKKALKQFDLLGISPVALPREYKEIFEADHVSDPLTLFFDYLDNLWKQY